MGDLQWKAAVEIQRFSDHGQCRSFQHETQIVRMEQQRHSEQEALCKMSGRGRGFGRGSQGGHRGRGSGGTLNRKHNNDKSTNDKDDKVEFTPHCAGKKQGATHDTVKKNIVHEIRQKCKCGNDLAESLETGSKRVDKNALFAHLGFTPTGFKDNNNPTEIESMEHTKNCSEDNGPVQCATDTIEDVHQ